LGWYAINVLRWRSWIWQRLEYAGVGSGCGFPLARQGWAHFRGALYTKSTISKLFDIHNKVYKLEKLLLLKAFLTGTLTFCRSH
jgi:hypothetical protein